MSGPERARPRARRHARRRQFGSSIGLRGYLCARAARTATVFALAALLLITPSAQAIAPGPARIEVTVRQVSASTEGARTIRVMSILNRPAYRKPIGEAVLVCNRAKTKLYACREYFRLQRGQIVADGLVTDLGFYGLAVTGGTGYYDTVGGSLIVQEIGRDAWSVVINLQGF